MYYLIIVWNAEIKKNILWNFGWFDQFTSIKSGPMIWYFNFWIHLYWILIIKNSYHLKAGSRLYRKPREPKILKRLLKYIVRSHPTYIWLGLANMFNPTTAMINFKNQSTLMPRCVNIQAPVDSISTLKFKSFLDTKFKFHVKYYRGKK